MSKRLTWIAAAPLLLASLGVQPASAARPHNETICVDPGSPACEDSIQAAIDQAVDGDIIEISAHAYYENIEVDKNITLQGTAGDFLGELTTIHPHDGQSPPMHILPDMTVSMRLIRITGGQWVSGESRGGGGIWNEGVLHATNILVENNTVVGNGGGIYSTGMLDLVDSVVMNNSAVYQGYSTWASGNGGGIFSHLGVTRLNATRVNSNSADLQGGGLYISGTLNMTDSTVSHNSASAAGGGVVMAMLNVASAIITTGAWERVTVDHNWSGSYGGGVDNEGGIFTMNNVTLSGNTATGRGGAIVNGALEHDLSGAGTLTISYSTIARNVSLAGQGGGLANRGLPHDAASTIILSTSILAHNQGGNCLVEEPAMFQSWDYNLSDDDTCNLPYHRDLMSTDPMLNPLALNAPGQVMTHALRIGSPADDLMYQNDGGTDARGVPRGVPLCDVGAYEGTEEPKYLQIPVEARVTVKVNATCRFGPSTAYAATGYLSAGEEHDVTGRNEGGTWLRLEECWVARILLQVDVDVLSISVAAAPPLPTVPAAVCKPTMGQSECEAAGGKWVAGIPGVSKGSCNCP